MRRASPPVRRAYEEQYEVSEEEETAAMRRLEAMT